MRALAHVVWGEGAGDCTRCTRDRAVRERLGCDAPAPDPTLTISCSACAGRDPACEHCGGTNEVDFWRCARRVAEVEQPRVGLVFRLFQQYLDHGALPAAGGFADQTAAIAASFGIIEGERNLIERRRVERQNRERMAEQMRGRR